MLESRVRSGKGPTRGHGALEGFLARKRAKKANTLISDESRTGRILDIGCGETPGFLLDTQFGLRVGLEKRPPNLSREPGVAAVVSDVEKNPYLPFKSASFDVVTMLAVLEHLRADRVVKLLNEIHRALKPGGSLILTTPPKWTDPILAGLARVGLVSHEEIDEHKKTYTPATLSRLFRETAFGDGPLEVGYFEGMLNMWARATRTA